MGKFDFEIQPKEDPPDPEALRAPVPRTRTQLCVTWLTLVPVVACATLALVYGWTLSARASAEIARRDDWVRHAAASIAPYSAELEKWVQWPAALEQAWRTNQTHRLAGARAHLLVCRIMSGVALGALLPAFVIWYRGQWGRGATERQVDLLQVGLCCLTVSVLAGVWRYDVRTVAASATSGDAHDLGDVAAALVVEAKAKHLAPWRAELNAALVALRPASAGGGELRQAAEAVNRLVRDGNLSLVTAAEKNTLSRAIEALARAHYRDDAFEPLARAYGPFTGELTVEAMLAEHARETKVFADDREAAEFLFRAIANDSEADVRLVIRRGLDLHVLGAGPEGGCTPLYAAVRYRRTTIAGLILATGVCIDIPCAECGAGTAGDTPLHAAVGEPTLTRLLLENGANPDATNRAGQTALHLAAERGDRTSVKLLAQHRANVNCLDQLGRTPLDLTNDPAATDAARGANGLLQELGGVTAVDLKRNPNPATAPVATTPQN
jgi:26S proteasome non-ATPase regulatory subunit 10